MKKGDRRSRLRSLRMLRVRVGSEPIMIVRYNVFLYLGFALLCLSTSTVLGPGLGLFFGGELGFERLCFLTGTVFLAI